jgi:hypothetical protein
MGVHKFFAKMGRSGKMRIGIPSGYVKIAIENGHRNSGFTHYPIEHGDVP